MSHSATLCRPLDQSRLAGDGPEDSLGTRIGSVLELGGMWLR